MFLRTYCQEFANDFEHHKHKQEKLNSERLKANVIEKHWQDIKEKCSAIFQEAKKSCLAIVHVLEYLDQI